MGTSTAGFASAAGSIAGGAASSLEAARGTAATNSADPAAMIEFQMAAAQFGITMSALSNGLKAYTDGMKTPADNAR